MWNLDAVRLMHRHGDEWMAMTPRSDHSPDSRDPERRMLRGEQIYRCVGCDEEISMTGPDAAG